jgi:hypothetical protein
MVREQNQEKVESLTPKQRLEAEIRHVHQDYEGRFKRNQYANNAIIGLSIVLTILIAITGTSPKFKDPSNPLSEPLGVSASAWLGLVATALVSIQKLYSIPDKISFYPLFIVRMRKLLDQLETAESAETLQEIRKELRQLQTEEATQRPVERPAS